MIKNEKPVKYALDDIKEIEEINKFDTTNQ